MTQHKAFCRLGPRGIALAAVTLAVFVSSATAAPRSIDSAALSRITAKRPVVDTILPASRRPKARAAGVRTQQWTDGHGHTVTISTDLPTVDLAPFASVLAGLRHGEEIQDLRVEAVTMATIGAICGDPAAVACYAPDDPELWGTGQMWFAVDDPDVVHTIVHEYGHHMDNQLANFGHFGGPCGFDNDGSRAWFFARDLEDDILGAGASCRPESDWEHLLGELFAEDFVALNGIRSWQLASFRSPSDEQLDALDYDLQVPFEPRSWGWRPRVRLGRWRSKTVTLEHFAFLTIELRSPRRRDFDLFLYRAGKRRPTASSLRTGRRDRIERVLPPGRYDVAVYGYRGTGRASVEIVAD